MRFFALANLNPVTSYASKLMEKVDIYKLEKEREREEHGVE